MTAAELTAAPARVGPHTPGIAGKLVDRGRPRLGEVRPRTAPYRVGGDDTPRLVAPLRSPLRRFPVVLVSPDLDTGRPLVAPADLTSRPSGLAVVAELAASDATFALEEAVGRAYGSSGAAP
jgi:hypothetical protein